MKIGIFSDIHSNLNALYAVMDFYKANPCDEYLCLGDVVGYGPNLTSVVTSFGISPKSPFLAITMQPSADV